MTALSVEDVRVSIQRGHEEIPAVTNVSFEVAPGEALGLVGESGSGKSLTLRALANILPPRTRRTNLDLSFGDADSHRLAMIFQEPLSAMSPTKRVVDLIAEGVMATTHVRRSRARERAIELMAEVGIPDPRHRAHMWPHELSGGLRQRVVIAMALSTNPTVLLCDEPTTALDVTVQDQILGLLDRLRQTHDMSMVFVTHDLAVVATLCQRIAVMYAGQIVEVGPTRQILTAPSHPYTAALLGATRARSGNEAARPIGGRPPDPESFEDKCRFIPRCRFAQPECHQPYRLEMVRPDQSSACVRAKELMGEVL